MLHSPHTFGDACLDNNTDRSPARPGSHMHFFSCAEKETQLDADAVKLLPTDGVVGVGSFKGGKICKKHWTLDFCFHLFLLCCESSFYLHTQQPSQVWSYKASQFKSMTLLPFSLVSWEKWKESVALALSGGEESSIWNESRDIHSFFSTLTWHVMDQRIKTYLLQGSI